MRKAFKLLEITFTAVAVVGFLMRISLIKGGDFLLVVSLGLLSLLYFLGGYFQGHPKPEGSDIPKATATEGPGLKIWSGIIFSIGIVGLAGTLLFWYGFSFHLLIGLVGSIGVLLGTYLAARKISPLALSSIFRRSAIIAAVCAVVWLTPTATLFRVFHRDDPQLIEKWTSARAHPNDPVYQADLDAYRRQKYAPSK